MSDEQVLQLMFSASNGEAVQSLYDGDTSSHADDHSSADLALVNHIAFYTQDTDQIDRVYRQSGLIRDKWDEKHSADGKTYGEMTILKALDGLNDTYSPPDAGKSGGQSKQSASSPAFPLIPITQIMSESFATDWLIKHLLPADSTAMIFGPPSSCKSLTVMEMAYCIGTGEDYYGHPVKRGNIVYIAGEGRKGINKRFQALFIAKGQMPENIVVSGLSMDLQSPDSVESVKRAVEGIPDVRLIIIDTLHRNFTGDENLARDFANVMKHCDQLRNATGATIFLVHHSGHDSNNRGRGSSAMTAAMDVEYKTKESNKKITLSCTKMKDDEKPKDLKFDLKSVPLGQDEDGETITAPYLVKSTTFFTGDKSAELKGPDKLTFDTLKKLSSDSCIPVAKEEWRTACMEVYAVKQGAKDPAGAKRKQFDRSAKSLLDKGLVVVDNGCFIVAGTDVTTDEGDIDK